MRERKRKNGRLVKPKRPDAAALARPAVKYVSHAGTAGLLRDRLDLRTKVGRRYQAHVEALSAHIGGDPTLPQVELIDQASRLKLLACIAWAELLRAGTVTKDTGLHPAFDAFLKASRDQRAVLGLLGIQRSARDVTLRDVLGGRVQHE